MVSARWIGAACLGLLAATMPANRASAGIITASNTTIGVFDGSSGTRSVTFDGTESGFGTGEITKLTVSIGFGKAGIPLPRFNQMAFRLTNPTASTTVDLINVNDFGTGFLPFLGTLNFDDDATFVVNVLPNLLIPGTYRPTQSTPNNFLANFDGQSALGTWTLTIVDSTSGAPLGFGDFTLTIETVASPEPATLALAGVGIITLAVYRRRRGRARAAA